MRPTLDPAAFNESLSWRGVWSAVTTYKAGEAVHHNGSAFFSKQDGNLNQTPNPLADTDWWDRLALAGEASGHPDLAAHDALGLATDAELAAHAATPHGEAHPDLAAHNTLGLATQAELDAHASAEALALSNHINDTVDAHDASAISVADTAGDFAATQVEGALAELQADAEADAADLAAHEAEASHTNERVPTNDSVTNAKVAAAAAIAESKLALASDAAAGTASRRSLGTGATQAAAGNHGHAQLHNRQHSVTDAADHTFPGGTTDFLRSDGTFAAPPGGGGEHPDLAAHDTLGLATQAELDAHDHDADYVNEADHTKAAHDALNIDADTLDGVDSAGFATAAHTHTEYLLLPYSDVGTATKVGEYRLYAPGGVTWTIAEVRASLDDAPAGSSYIVDVHKSGTTIFTTQSNRPTIAIAGNTDLADAIEVSSLASGEYLTVDIDQVGSTTTGGKLTVQVLLTRSV